MRVHVHMHVTVRYIAFSNRPPKPIDYRFVHCLAMELTPGCHLMDIDSRRCPVVPCKI